MTVTGGRAQQERRAADVDKLDQEDRAMSLDLVVTTLRARRGRPEPFGFRPNRLAHRQTPPTDPRWMSRWLGTIAVSLLLAVGLGLWAAAVQAATVSSNWAGYVIKGTSPKTRFQRVVGAWVQPSVKCTPGRRTYSAFWLGLGGYRRGSSKLEQTGTEADCGASGRATYSAWYEIVPAPPVRLALPVRPGDAFAASVTASGDRVVLHLRNLTSGRLASKRLRVSAPDTDTAEWIAEAPSSCDRTGCRALPLANFGTVNFAGASVQTASDQLGSISDSRWKAVAIEIQGDFEALSATGVPTFAGARPSALSSGASFSVAWYQIVAPSAPEPPTIGPPPGSPGTGPPPAE
jgi:hypothetical protein